MSKRFPQIIQAITIGHGYSQEVEGKAILLKSYTLVTGLRWFNKSLTGKPPFCHLASVLSESTVKIAKGNN